MKLLINGYTVTENLELKRNKNNIKVAERLIEHLKTNKQLYMRVVLIAALLIHFDSFVFASSGFEESLDRVGQQILDMLMVVARWGCLSFGVKEMVTTLLYGGNMKTAMNHGLLYLLGYIFISVYPQLFTLFQGIKF